jgi:hypothetical protein
VSKHAYHRGRPRTPGSGQAKWLLRDQPHRPTSGVRRLHPTEIETRGWRPLLGDQRWGGSACAHREPLSEQGADPPLIRSSTEHGKTCRRGFRGSPDQTDMRAPCRCQSRITSLPASDLSAREADSGWQCSRKLQRPQRHMGSAFKCCQPLRLCRSEPAVSRCPS